MVNYKCPRCGFNSNIKTKYMMHLKRKYICESKISDNNLYKEYLKYNITSKLNNEKMAENNEKEPEKYDKNNTKLMRNQQKTPENDEKTPENDEKTPEIFIPNDGYEKKSDTKDECKAHIKKKCKKSVNLNNIYSFDGQKLGRNIYKNYPQSGDIYIIQTDYISNDHYVIGVTKHISKRICQYRASNVYEPRLYYFIPCQDIEQIDNLLKIKLCNKNVKKDIYKGNLEEIKNIVITLISENFDVNNPVAFEPTLKLGDLTQCKKCEKSFYTPIDLFFHFNTCEEYKEKLNKNKLYHCEYCKSKFSTESNLVKHLKNCKEKIKDDTCKRDMMELVNRLNEQLEKQSKQLEKKDKQLEIRDNEFRKQLEKKDRQIDELIQKAGIQNSNITNNIQQNIKILAYKNTDMSHLTDNDFMYCLNRSNMCIPHLIKKIHFNPKKPENHNVYISNIKNKYVMVYDGNKWNLHNQNETIDELIDTNEGVLEQKLEEWIENGNEYPEIMKKFNRYLEKKEKDEVINKIKEEIKLILFNNRKIIKFDI